MKTTALTATVALALAGGAAGWQIVRPARTDATDTTPAVAVSSAVVSRGDIVSLVQFPGTLEYEGSYSIVSQLPPGVVTSVAGAGRVLTRGSALFTVGPTSAVLLYGAKPAYRDFFWGMTDGSDVLELERNLVALGMDPSATMTVDQHFSAATAAAVRRWQVARGLPLAARTGRLTLGEVVFRPGKLRVGHVGIAAGQSAGPGTGMLTVSWTRQVVNLPLTTDQRSQVHAGNPVEITLPGSTQVVRGRVRRVGSVATAPTQANQNGGNGADGGPATINVTIDLIKPGKTLRGLDLSPVQVAITSAQRRGVLTVPITALLARPGGGYQVAVLDGAHRTLVPVEPGLYDDQEGTVEVTGDGISAGVRVEVPVDQ
jgi:peptidoglycan hydrolase-like protein with peptidoglycan-binding domain